ncbi:hypothetical protein [Marinobacter salexigens]|uniref:Uncharacterized protein n=1 Tax=Marinobacter salexigens TaxID=1925763 RepID=A0ABS6A6D6_9GAMM|nr:hypothetical protein [Marinobacter salexigens]MBU2873339.1 hypothetical protein [Marinobacter salexigens]
MTYFGSHFPDKRGLPDKKVRFTGCQGENPGYILISMKTTQAICQLNVLQAFSQKAKDAVAAVFFWWFGYGFYFSQRLGRP